MYLDIGTICIILAADQNIFKLQLYNEKELKLHTLRFEGILITIGGKFKELQLFNMHLPPFSTISNWTVCHLHLEAVAVNPHHAVKGSPCR